jgi:hypothetical protein
MPKASRKTLAVLVIIIIGVAAGISLLWWWYNQRTPEEELESFSNYGFSFKYPKDMGISEENATEDFGMLVGEVGRNEELEFIKVSWLTLEFNPGLEVFLNVSFYGLESEGFIIQGGQIKNYTTAKGYEMLYQSFSGTDAQEIPLEGVSGVWYCSTSQRSFEFVLVFVQSGQDVNSKFLQYVNSFTCT